MTDGIEGIPEEDASEANEEEPLEAPAEQEERDANTVEEPAAATSEEAIIEEPAE